jgi:hypothetical protein
MWRVGAHISDAVGNRREWTRGFSWTRLPRGMRDTQRDGACDGDETQTGGLPLTQATLVRGASGADNTSASRLLPGTAAFIADLYEKRFSYKNIASKGESVKGQVETNGSVHSRIGA